MAKLGLVVWCDGPCGNQQVTQRIQKAITKLTSTLSPRATVDGFQKSKGHTTAVGCG